jgi:hypothetical protein
MEEFLLSCITKSALQKNLKRKENEKEVIKAWADTYENIDLGKLDEISLVNFFKSKITNDGTHLEAFRVVTKISSALSLAINQTTTSNHFKSLNSKIGGYNRDNLAKAIGCNRPELSKLLNKIGLGKRERKANFSDEEATEIKYLLTAYKNEKDRVTAYKAMKKSKNLTALKEEDLFIAGSRRLSKVNKRTGVFD